MNQYIVFDAGGNILRTGSCPASHVDLQAGQGEYVIEGVAQDDLHMVVDGRIVDKSPPPPPTQAVLQKICRVEMRLQRNVLLSNSDWTQVADSPISEETKVEWQAYRQALRDLPATYSNATSIDQVIFPTPPGD